MKYLFLLRSFSIIGYTIFFGVSVIVARQVPGWHVLVDALFVITMALAQDKLWPLFPSTSAPPKKQTPSSVEMDRNDDGQRP